ncbi:MAG: flagellar motor switch protein FliG [Ignavibacteriae bacterium HGW-Ignavibacteriae-3]|nr:MAG: flagellar motor switch protein FliG [Ignavibacteriae bacterium HGW-Ignavibacteriae-3]
MRSNDKLQLKDLGEEISGSQKAAMLMVALNVEAASLVLRYLDPADVENLTAEISKVKNISSKTADKVIDEFYSMVTAREYVLEGGLDFAQAVLEKSYGSPKAIEIIEKVKRLTTMKGFDVLKKAEPAQLVNFLNKEHPQTMALILSQLSPDQTANALKELPEELRIDVVYRIATLGKIAPQTLKQIEHVVDEIAGASMSQSVGKLGGAKCLAAILNRTNVAMVKELLDKLEGIDTETTYEVKRLMFIFEEIINIADKDIQKIMREIDRKDLALALKISDDKLREKIFKNMSERAADLLKEELQYMGMVKLKEVEGAQARIIDVIKRLEEQGEISLNLRGGPEEVYV